ncbi:MAG: tripartite tricarboxylate transporter substrate-binding protein, partial [Casimicrobiaceae bacterium]
MALQRARTWGLGMLLAGLSAVAAAQDYPNKPIRFIVPYPPAGGTDVVARILTEPLGAVLGQPIVIDNRGGAAGNVGTDIAAKAAADGYNILFTLSSHTINPKLYGKLPFDVEKDFVPISLAAMIPQILVVHPSVPAN